MKKQRGSCDTQGKRSGVSGKEQEVRNYQGKFFGAAVIHQRLNVRLTLRSEAESGAARRCWEIPA